jgi:hypothetical protein
MTGVSNDVERKQHKGKNRNDGLMTWGLILAGLNGTAGGATAVAGRVRGSLSLRGTAEELEAGDGFERAMRHERHPGERQQQSEHCFYRPHA